MLNFLLPKIVAQVMKYCCKTKYIFFFQIRKEKIGNPCGIFRKSGEVLTGKNVWQLKQWASEQQKVDHNSRKQTKNTLKRLCVKTSRWNVKNSKHENLNWEKSICCYEEIVLKSITMIWYLILLSFINIGKNKNWYNLINMKLKT